MMNALTFSDLKARLGELIERDSTADQSYIANTINEAYLGLCNTIRLDPLRRTTFLQTEAVYETGTVSVTAQSTTVTGVGTTFTEEMIGRTIILQNIPYRISAFTSTTVITIDRPYEDTTALSGANYAIYKDKFQLPYNCDYTRIWSLKDTYTPQKLRLLNRHNFIRRYPNPQDVGHPVFYVPMGYEEARHPASEASLDAADAGTSTTSVVFTDAGSAMSGVDDYYNDWLLVNATREEVSLVTDYDQATKTVTISPAITGQVATDEVALLKNMPSISLYPYPDDAFNLQMIYYKTPNRMRNDYDVPIIPHRYHELIYWGAGIRAGMIRDDSRRREIKEAFQEKLVEMSEEYGTFEEEISAREAMDSNIDENANPMSLYDYPLGS